MADEQQQNAVTENTAGERAENTTQEPQEGAQETMQGETQPDTQAKEEVPAEVLRDELTQARKDAANYRTQVRDLQEKLSNAKSAEEVSQITADFDAKLAELEIQNLRTSIAYELQLPPAAAKRLAGSTEEELRADAKELAELFGSAKAPRGQRDLRGGLDPSENHSGFDVAGVRSQMPKRR